MGELVAGGDAGEPEQRAHGHRRPYQPRAQARRRHRAQREEHRDLGRRRVAERPEPEVVADAAPDADEGDGEPAARREARQRVVEALARGEDAKNPTEASIANALTGSVGYF